MAFVFRAKRDLKLSDIEQNNVYPGEYYKENQLVKNIEKQSSEFQSKSSRDLQKNKFNTPGPGSYEKNIIYYDIFSNMKKKKKYDNIFDTVKSNVIPKEVQKFLASNQAIAFNTRGGRFNYKIEELEKEKSKPGPGSYSPNASMSMNSKKILSTNNESTINNKSNNNICINSYNSSKTNNFSVKSNNKSYQSTNENTSRSRLVKKTKTFNSDYRTETIPSKGNLGYDIDQNGDKKMIINNNESNYMSGNKNDSAGPGQYNIQINWEKNFLSWQKMKDEKDEKYNIIKERKNLSPLTQLEKDYLMNSQRRNDNTKFISKTKTANYNAKAKLFNIFLNNRYDKLKNVNEKKEYDDFLFDGSPGPGYYSPHNTYFQSENYSAYDKSKKNFNAKSPRFKTVNKANNDLGPGFYYKKNKPKKVEKPKYKLGFIDNPNKGDELCALKLSLAKESYKVPGPGSYEVEGNLLHEDISNNQNFGSNDRRFKKSIEIINNYPGPGTYEQKEGLGQENKNSNNKKNNVYTNYKTDLELIKQLDKIPKEVFSTPPVGLYNPNIISSMEYSAKSKINPYIDEKIVGFGIQEKKGTSFISKDNNRSVGPGRYYKNRRTDMKQNSSPFNQSDKRFDYEQMYNNKIPGPGSYELNSFDDWNKKSHNILFV